MTGADDLPLTPYFAQAPKRKLSESSYLLCLAENWLHRLHSQGIVFPTSPGPQFAAHTIYYGEIFGYSTLRRRGQDRGVARLIGRHININPHRNEVAYGITGEISGIG